MGTLWDGVSMDKFHISADQLFYGDTLLGPTNLLHVDSNELKNLTIEHGVQHHKSMPERIDAVFIAGDKVIGVESKRPDDLLNSFLNRRLKRQLRTLLRTVDVPVLLIRGPIPEELTTYDKNQIPIFWRYKELNPLWEELARWQMMGAVVLNGPDADDEVPEFLNGMKKVLSGGRNVLVAIAGTDQGKEKEKEYGWLLRRIQGVGKATTNKLLTNHTPHDIFEASPKTLMEWGANRTQAQAIWEATQ